MYLRRFDTTVQTYLLAQSSAIITLYTICACVVCMVITYYGRLGTVTEGTHLTVCSNNVFLVLACQETLIRADGKKKETLLLLFILQ